VPIGAVQVQAAATLSAHGDGAFIVSHVRLVVQADGLAERADAVFAEAKRICAYFNATRGNTVVDVALA
jgi:organic hydroperoxide reductase OsmC/OhrA